MLAAAAVPHRPAMILSVDEVVAGAAPGVEQPDALARLAVEQPARKRDDLRALRDAVECETVAGVRAVATNPPPPRGEGRTQLGSASRRDRVGQYAETQDVHRQ